MAEAWIVAGAWVEMGLIWLRCSGGVVVVVVGLLLRLWLELDLESHTAGLAFCASPA